MNRPFIAFAYPRDRFSLVLWVALFCVLVVLCLFVSGGENPWDREISRKLVTGEKLSIRDIIVSGLWAAGVLNAGIVALLLIFSPWWTKADLRKLSAAGKLPGQPEEKGKQEEEKAGEAQAVLKAEVKAEAEPASRTLIWERVLFWSMILLAVLAAAWLRWPRLDDSLFNDEEQAFRKFIYGEYTVTEDGKLEFKPVNWERAWFYTINGNNHVLQNVLSKALHHAWQQPAGTDLRAFNEEPLRIGPLVLGALTVAAVGGLAWMLFGRASGAAAAWLLALHPWHVRYSVEARGYSGMLLFVVLTLIFLALALRYRGWGWWLAFGIAQCAYLLHFAGALYLAVAMNLVIFGMLIWKRDETQFWRWTVANTLGAVIFLQIMTPALIRIWMWIKEQEKGTFEIGWDFFQDLWAHMCAGIPWNSFEPTLHNGISVADYQSYDPLAYWGIALVIPVLTVAALVWAVIKVREARWITAAMVGAVVLIRVHNHYSHTEFYSWYLYYLMIGMVIFLAALPSAATKLAGKKWPGAGWITAFAIVLLYAVLISDPLKRMREYDRQPMRQAVETVRGEVPALSEDHFQILTGSVGSGQGQIQTYDPWIREIDEAGDLEDLIADARTEHKPLFIYCCSPFSVKVGKPEVFDILQDRDVFERMAYHRGMEEYWSYQIYKLKTKSE